MRAVPGKNTAANVNKKSLHTVIQIPIYREKDPAGGEK
jgi:hypothetical protein